MHDPPGLCWYLNVPKLSKHPGKWAQVTRRKPGRNVPFQKVSLERRHQSPERQTPNVLHTGPRDSNSRGIVDVVWFQRTPGIKKDLVFNGCLDDLMLGFSWGNTGKNMVLPRKVVFFLLFGLYTCLFF